MTTTKPEHIHSVRRWGDLIELQGIRLHYQRGQFGDFELDGEIHRGEVLDATATRVLVLLDRVQ